MLHLTLTFHPLTMFYLSKTILLKDSDKELVMLAFGEARGLIKSQLALLKVLLEHYGPDHFQPIDSSQSESGFTSIHCDIFSRFAEKVCFVTQVAYLLCLQYFIGL